MPDDCMHFSFLLYRLVFCALFLIVVAFCLVVCHFCFGFFSIGLCTSSPQPSSTCILKFFHTTLRECEWLAACVVMSLALSAKKRFLFALDVLHRFVIVFFLLLLRSVVVSLLVGLLRELLLVVLFDDCCCVCVDVAVFVEIALRSVSIYARARST